MSFNSLLRTKCVYSFFKTGKRETGTTAQGEEQDTKVMLDWSHQWEHRLGHTKR
jgi:hypothetical protein